MASPAPCPAGSGPPAALAGPAVPSARRPAPPWPAPGRALPHVCMSPVLRGRAGRRGRKGRENPRTGPSSSASPASGQAGCVRLALDFLSLLPPRTLPSSSHHVSVLGAGPVPAPRSPSGAPRLPPAEAPRFAAGRGFLFRISGFAAGVSWILPGVCLCPSLLGSSTSLPSR